MRASKIHIPESIRARRLCTSSASGSTSTTSADASRATNKDHVTAYIQCDNLAKKCRFKRHPRIYSGRAAAGKARKSWPLLRSDRSELPVLLLDVCKAPVEVPPAPSVSVRPAETGSGTPGTACWRCTPSAYATSLHQRAPLDDPFSRTLFGVSTPIVAPEELLSSVSRILQSCSCSISDFWWSSNGCPDFVNFTEFFEIYLTNLTRSRF